MFPLNFPQRETFLDRDCWGWGLGAGHPSILPSTHWLWDSPWQEQGVMYQGIRAQGRPPLPRVPI